MYELSIRLYSLGVAIASLFNPKARKMLKGGREAFGVLADKIDGGSRYAWFHAASLGVRARPSDYGASSCRAS